MNNYADINRLRLIYHGKTENSFQQFRKEILLNSKEILCSCTDNISEKDCLCDPFNEWLTKLFLSENEDALLPLLEYQREFGSFLASKGLSEHGIYLIFGRIKSELLKRLYSIPIKVLDIARMARLLNDLLKISFDYILEGFNLNKGLLCIK